MGEIKIHVGKFIQREKYPSCWECEINTDELWECNTCGLKFCKDHIKEEGNGLDDVTFICESCEKERWEGNEEDN